MRQNYSVDKLIRIRLLKLDFLCLSCRQSWNLFLTQTDVEGFLITVVINGRVDSTENSLSFNRKTAPRVYSNRKHWRKSKESFRMQMIFQIKNAESEKRFHFRFMELLLCIKTMGENEKRYKEMRRWKHLADAEWFQSKCLFFLSHSLESLT